jgi:oxygen-independent coproporphyrinogen-3 oxidase
VPLCSGGFVGCLIQIAQFLDEQSETMKEAGNLPALSSTLFMPTPLGVYISIPFCKAKCTFCNFASGAFAPSRMQRYADRLCDEIKAAGWRALSFGGRDAAAGMERNVLDTLFFGGGTPSLLSPDHLRQLFQTLRAEFSFQSAAEITLECAPGQLSDETLAELLQQGMNRISLGVQSFVDRESAAVGRLHNEQIVLDELAHLRAAGLQDMNVDLIVGLPHQTRASWQYSLDAVIATGVPHISIYMLEVDDESRLGREMLAEGTRYSAAAVPSEDDAADWYQLGCERLNAAGIHQYEISNFAREGHRSRHNLKYWRRDPYLGFGLDAHSMLLTPTGAVRFSNTSDLDLYSADSEASENSVHLRNPLALYPEARAAQSLPAPDADHVNLEQAFEEALFLGLRLNEGVSLVSLRHQFGEALLDQIQPALDEVHEAGLLSLSHGGDTDCIALTDRGRMVSNEVFSRLLLPTPA